MGCIHHALSLCVRACPLWPKVVHFSLERRALTGRGNTPLKMLLLFI